MFDSSPRALTAAILAGGRSSRMGADKPSLLWRGRSLLQTVAEACLGAGLPVVVVGRPEPPGWSLEDVRFVADDAPGSGPLGGIVTALRRCASEPGAAVLAVAADLPLLDAAAVSWLVDHAHRRAAGPGLVTVTDRPEPLFAVYGAAALPGLAGALASGDVSVSRAIAANGFERVSAPAWVARRLTNVNTPADLAALGDSAGTAAPDSAQLQPNRVARVELSNTPRQRERG